MIDWRAELLHAYWVILDGLADLMFLPEPVRKAAGIGEGFSGIDPSAQWDFVSSTLPGESAWLEEENQMLWNAIFNSTAPHIYETDCNKGVAKYTSTKKLLVKHMEDRGNTENSICQSPCCDRLCGWDALQLR